jgi:hypothetical protein
MANLDDILKAKDAQKQADKLEKIKKINALKAALAAKKQAAITSTPYDPNTEKQMTKIVNTFKKQNDDINQVGNSLNKIDEQMDEYNRWQDRK